jgi:hypothetical protein
VESITGPVGATMSNESERFDPDMKIAVVVPLS